MRVFHLANSNSTNVGNGALIEGTERTLREDSAEPLQFHREPWDDYNFERKFDADFVARVNAESDLFLIGGAVAINGRPYLTQAGMRVDLPLPLWERIECPIVLHGISYRFWDGQPFHHLDHFRETVQFLHAHPRVLFGVRNDGTKAWMQRLLGLELPKVIEVPDPALYVPTVPAVHPELHPDRQNLLIAFNNEDSNSRFADEAQRSALLKHLAEAVTQLCDSHPLNLVLCPHYFDDFIMIGEFMRHLPPRLAHRHTVAAGMQRASQACYFYDLYAQADLVIAMRVHAMSPAIGLGVPVVPIVSQSRMSDFLQDIGLNDLGLAHDGADFKDRLVALCSTQLSEPRASRERLGAARHRCRERTRAFNQLTLKLAAEVAAR